MMNKNNKTRFLVVMTLFLGLNLLILGKALAQNQTVSLNVMEGNVVMAVPQQVSFPRLILAPPDSQPPAGGFPNNSTLVLSPLNDLQTVQILDPATGDAFTVSVTLRNLVNEQREILPYGNLGIVTLHAGNPVDPVDTGTVNNPPGTNGVYSDPALNYYYDPTNNPVTQFPDGNFMQFPVDPLDPDPLDEGSVSMPIVIMQRDAETPSVGIYSIGLGLRANMGINQPSGNFAGELTFSYTPL